MTQPERQPGRDRPDRRGPAPRPALGARRAPRAGRRDHPRAAPAGHVGDGRARRRPQAPDGARPPGRLRGHGAGREGARLPDRRHLRRRPGPRVREEVRDDPYRYLPTLGEFDLYLIGEGRHEQLWHVLGAHVREVGQATGTSFAVWAPNARGVRVIGDFNYWDGRAYPMRSLGGSGVWELFVPGVADGATVQVRDLRAGRGVAGEGRPDGQRRRAARPPPRRWCTPRSTTGTTRTGWRRGPSAQPVREPMSVYEVHLGSWRPGLSYRELADRARRLRDRPRLHPRGVPARRRAPVRRLVGLPGHLVLRADLAVRHARTTSATWSTRCTRRASA